MLYGKDDFSRLNPCVNILFFVCAVGFCVFSMHPITVLISFVSSVLWLIKLRGSKGLKLSLKMCLPVMLLTAIVNPAFNHRGSITLVYLPSGNPLTLESIIYGFVAACMLCGVLLWCISFGDIMTSEKYIYLFGRAFPSLGLLISMIFSFIPRFSKRFALVRDAQLSLNPNMFKGNIIKRFKGTLSVFSAVVTWALESAVSASDSMKSRGYGVRNRTFYSPFVFSDRDKLILVYLAFAIVYLLSVFISGGVVWNYYPQLSGVLFTTKSVCAYIVYASLCFFPVLFDIKEERKWKSLISAI